MYSDSPDTVPCVSPWEQVFWFQNIFLEQHKELFSENGAAFGAMPFLRYGYVQNRLEVYKTSSIMIYKR